MGVNDGNGPREAKMDVKETVELLMVRLACEDGRLLGNCETL